MVNPPRITGTFLDEITHDIPSQNWGRSEWRKEFELYRRIGIDTLVVIRAGYRDKCIFPAKSITQCLPVYDDLAEIFLDLADELGLWLFFGTYDSGLHWHVGSWWKEVDVNKAFVDEVVERYGHHKSFSGWYVCHETSRDNLHIIDLFNEIGTHCKGCKDLPVLISPFPQGAKQPGPGAMSLAESFEHWDRIFAATRGAVDICAFQDGQIGYEQVRAFVEGIAGLGAKHGVRVWSNLETFDRDMPIKFPPGDWRHIRMKLEAAAERVEKIITFEFPHFMSPHSCYLAAHNLFGRYAEYAGLQR